MKIFILFIKNIFSEKKFVETSRDKNYQNMQNEILFRINNRPDIEKLYMIDNTENNLNDLIKEKSLEMEKECKKFLEIKFN